ARDRIGGRCWTAREFADGQIAEHGGEFIDTRHVHIRQLAKELGLKMDDLWSGWVPGSKWFMWVNDERNVWGDWKDEQEPVVNAAINEAKRLGVVGNGKKYDDAPLSYGTATPEAVEMDQMSMADWLEEKSPGTAGAPIGTLLNEFMQAWYGLDMKDLSSLNWIDFYVAPWPGGDERWRVHGGNDQVTTLSAEALPAGTVRLEAPLESLRKTGDTYELRFGGIPDPVVADFVIMTIPFTTLKDVDLTDAGFSGQRVGAIDNLSMGLDVKMFLQYDRRPEEFDMWSGGMEHTNPNFETWESSEAQKGKAGLITIYSGGTGSETFAHENYHAPAPQEMTDLMLGEINKVVPGTEAHFNGKAWLDYWVGDPWTRGSYAAFGQGEYTKYWRYTGLPEGNVKFAGEHTSTYSQGFLNGGVESGQRAAIEVMDDLGVKVPAQIADMPYSKFG
ncbi:MAG: FAD-dependent oxidoreductase, partial [Actinomycetota bacterium]